MRFKLGSLLLKGFFALTLAAGAFAFWHFNDNRAPRQPIAFSHKIHVEANLPCLLCHQRASDSPQAGIPSVRFCMVCHASGEPDGPEIQKVRAYFEEKREVPWVRVYGFTPDAHVYFNHERHVAAEIDCSVCHGDLGQMTVAERAVEHTMGWCMACHAENSSKFASPELANDCLTCHF